MGAGVWDLGGAQGPSSGRGGDCGGQSTGPEAHVAGAHGEDGARGLWAKQWGLQLWAGSLRSVSEVVEDGRPLLLEAPVGRPPAQLDTGTALFCPRALTSRAQGSESCSPRAGGACLPFDLGVSLSLSSALTGAGAGGAWAVCACVLVTRVPWASPWVVRCRQGD